MLADSDNMPLQTFRNGAPDSLDDASSPLLSPRNSQRTFPHADNPDDNIIPTRSTSYLFFLALGFCGLQIVWSVEYGYGSPYLISLGLSKSHLAFAWLAGPLSGTLVQPYVGAMSDNCRSKWGRRRPFILGGAAATIMVLFLLAWSQDLVSGGLHAVLGLSPESAVVRNCTIAVAIVSMYVLDAALNTVQATLRALIADVAPEHQQQPANAWASGIMGAGTILGYVFGYLDLPKYLSFLGDSQFKILCAISSASLASAVLVTCLCITERNPNLDSPAARNSKGESMGLVAFFRHVISSIRRLPAQIRGVCMVQLAAWIAWFPFLFYVTTYIGQLYVDPIFTEHPNLKDDDITRAWEDATRVGAYALVINSIVAFATNVILPVFIQPMSGANAPSPSSSSSSAAVSAVKSFLSRLRVPGLTLRRAWLISHVIFALAMFSTFFIASTPSGIAFVGTVGVCWALAQWAPFTLISEVIAANKARASSNSSPEYSLARGRTPSQSTTYPWSFTRDGETRSLSEENGSDFGSVVTAIYNPRPAPLVTQSSSVTTVFHVPDNAEANNSVPGSDPDSAPDPGLDPGPESEDSEESIGETPSAGIFLGIHNVAISLPQFFTALISSVIFSFTQKPRGVPGDTSVAWVFRLGGINALVAAWLTWRYVGEADTTRGDYVENRRRGTSNSRV